MFRTHNNKGILIHQGTPYKKIAFVDLQLFEQSDSLPLFAQIMEKENIMKTMRWKIFSTHKVYHRRTQTNM
jgi:hypothetical protein